MTDDSTFRGLYEHAPCGHLVLDGSGAIVRVNETFRVWTGFAAEELLGAKFDTILNPASRLFFESRYQPVLQLNGEIREATMMIVTPGGELFPVLVNARLDREGGETRVAVFDATTRQNYERDLMLARRSAEQSEARLRHLQDAAAVFSAAASPDAVARDLARIAREAFDATTASVMLVNQSGRLQPVVDHPLQGRTSSSFLPEVQAATTGRVVTATGIDDAAAAFPGIEQAMRLAHVAGFVVAPLAADGTVLGTLSCFFGRERELGDDGRQVLTALCRLAGLSLQRIELQSQLQHSALHDTLTGLANRDLLDASLHRALAAATRHSRPLSLVFLDLDGFKRINDDLGHAVGDAVLRDIATRLQRAVRANDTLARLGGDEFVLVCEETDGAAAERVAARLLETATQPLHGVPTSYGVTASIGVAVHVPEPGASAPTPKSLLMAADGAMYESKNAGKNRATLVAV